jgi:hypothetical protein
MQALEPQSATRSVSPHCEAGCIFSIDLGEGGGGSPACEAAGQEMRRAVSGQCARGWPSAGASNQPRYYTLPIPFASA